MPVNPGPFRRIPLAWADDGSEWSVLLVADEVNRGVWELLDIRRKADCACASSPPRSRGFCSTGRASARGLARRSAHKERTLPPGAPLTVGRRSHTWVASERALGQIAFPASRLAVPRKRVTALPTWVEVERDILCVRSWRCRSPNGPKKHAEIPPGDRQVKKEPTMSTLNTALVSVKWVVWVDRSPLARQCHVSRTGLSTNPSLRPRGCGIAVGATRCQNGVSLS